MLSSSSLLSSPNAVKVIKGEIHNVLSVMRAQARGTSASDAMQNSHVWSSLRQLSDVLTSVAEEQTLDVVSYVSPFGTAVVNREVNADVTGAALSALHKFLLYGFVSVDSPGAREGLTLMARSIRHCTFEETKGKNEEEVVLKLLNLSAMVVRCAYSAGALLAPSDVVGIFDTCLHVSHKAQNASPLLKSAAGDALGHIVLVVFSRPEVATVEKHSKAASASEAANEGSNDSQSDDDWGEADPGGGNSDGMLRQAPFTPSKEPLELSSSSPAARSSNNTASENGGVSTTTGSISEAETSDMGTAEERKVPPKNGPVVVSVMYRLANLVNPLNNSDATCVLSLTLINIVLETYATSKNPPLPELMEIMQNTLCQHLLQWSTTSDLVLLNLALRVIFNLFQSSKNHLKVQLEVFLTSVHLRILPSPEISQAQKEVVMESLLEFCQEPALMQDIYLNYDCDVHCTNLFEAICTTLAKMGSPHVAISTEPKSKALRSSSTPEKNTAKDSEARKGHDTDMVKPGRPLNPLNRLALEGILAVVDSIARRCYVPTPSNGRALDGVAVTENGATGPSRKPRSDSFSSFSSGLRSPLSDADSDAGELSEASEHWMGQARERTAQVLKERKQRKHNLARVTLEFNKRPTGKEWMQSAERLGILPTPATPQAVASLLYSTPKLDKTQMGIYLSKGPVESYPFIADVRDEFVALFDFAHMAFSEALRSFLLKFRLPGEAQCIDRLMEAFSKQLFKQQVMCTKSHETVVAGENNVKTPRSSHSINDDGLGFMNGLAPMVNDNEKDADASEKNAAAATENTDVALPSIFKSADAVFILSFSTIMLNTDLHNPNMKDEKRMTLEQFIRNNRGINDGDNLPEEFLTELFYQIQEDEIQVQKDFDLQDAGSAHWDGIISNKSNLVATPFFTPADTARRANFPAGVHERDMFLAIAPSGIQCIANVFGQSWNDMLVVKALKGFKEMAKICTYYGMDEMFNEIIETLLRHGRDYIMSSIALEAAGYEKGTILSSRSRHSHKPTLDVEVHSDLTEDEDTVIDEFSPVPHAQLTANAAANGPAGDNLGGSAAHKGLLSLDCAFTLIRTQPTHIREAWPILIEVLCALRDARSLPMGLADLDDFADSNGVILPPSAFALRSQRKLEEYYASFSTVTGKKASVGLWASVASHFLGKSPLKMTFDSDIETDFFHPDGKGAGYKGPPQGEPSSFAKALLSVTRTADLDLLVARSTELPYTIQRVKVLLNALDLDPEVDDPLFESHAVFALELAARTFFSNMDRAPELYPMFKSKFEEIIMAFEEAAHSFGTNDQPPAPKMDMPYLVERIVVTILRSCIHLHDVDELRTDILSSLELILAIPAWFIGQLADRIGCGMAIILRGSFTTIEGIQEWKLIAALLKRAVVYHSGRGFVFDGIASCVEYALPSPAYQSTHAFYKGEENDEIGISYEGCIVFARMLVNFVVGRYEGDMSMSVPAMLCLEKIYAHILYLTTDHSAVNESGEGLVQPIPDEELWQTVSTSFHSVGLSEDPDTSRQGIECLQRLIMTTAIDSVSDARWLTLLEMLSLRQPSVSAETARHKLCAVLGKVLLLVVPKLSKKRENWDPLTKIVNQTARVVSENLLAGRQGSVSPLFESTLQTVTNLSNVMCLPEFCAETDGFSQWAGETLLAELEKVGASGYSNAMLAATAKTMDEGHEKPNETSEDEKSPKDTVLPVNDRL